MMNGRGRPGWWQKRRKPIHGVGDLAAKREYEIIEDGAGPCVADYTSSVDDLLLSEEQLRDCHRLSEALRHDAIRAKFHSSPNWQKSVAAANALRAAHSKGVDDWIVQNCSDFIGKRGAPNIVQKRMRDAGYKAPAISTIRRHMEKIKNRSG
ncbi:MAG: hypothetical protein K0M39_14745 [Rhizobium sp.]|nr:hypothetical protein [Rhizobium sp.]